jgi:N-acetylglucosamine kinase-like BadF-type ATPase
MFIKLTANRICFVENSGVPARATNDSLLLASHIITDQIEHAGSGETSWGVCVVAGTGSVITGVQVGEDAIPVVFGRVGGHGHVFGDEGSGESAQSQVLE